MRISNKSILATAAPVAVTTTYTSKAIWLGHIANYAIQMSYIGASGATVKLQASCDEGNDKAQAQNAEEANITNWSDVAGSSKALTASTADNTLHDVANAGYNWVRVVVTGTVTIQSLRFNVKGV